MQYRVVFSDSPSDLESSEYLAALPEWQRVLLEKFVAQLLTERRIDHPDARRIDSENWSLWLRREGEDAVNHVCRLVRYDEPLLSDFERQLLDPNAKASAPRTSPAKRLVILNIDTHAVAIGKADEYVDPVSYASLMDSIQRDVFLQTIEAIKASQSSPDFSHNPDGTIAIHIDKPALAYGVHIHCTAKWV